jgi:hypothetical protein
MTSETQTLKDGPMDANANIVATKEALEQAGRAGAALIVVTGSLADDLKKAEPLSQIRGTALNALLAAAPEPPPAIGLSSLNIITAGALTGLDLATVTNAVATGTALVLEVFREYEEGGYAPGRLILKRRRINAL